MYLAMPRASSLQQQPPPIQELSTSVSFSMNGKLQATQTEQFAHEVARDLRWYDFAHAEICARVPVYAPHATTSGPAVGGNDIRVHGLLVPAVISGSVSVQCEQGALPLRLRLSLTNLARLPVLHRHGLQANGCHTREATRTDHATASWQQHDGTRLTYEQIGLSGESSNAKQRKPAVRPQAVR